MEYPILLERFKACHFLGANKEKIPPVIMRSFYFHGKNEKYYRWKPLWSKLNPFNHRPLFVTERLPVHDLDVKQYAEQLGLVTTTRNSQVRIYHRDQKGKTMTFQVNNRANMFVLPRVTSNASVWENTSVLLNTLKRLREEMKIQSAKTHWCCFSWAKITG